MQQEVLRWLRQGATGSVAGWADGSGAGHSGFDLIYACQDVEHDKQEKLYSWPSRRGMAAALFMAKANHVLTLLVLVLLGLVMTLGWPYWIALAITAGLLAYENSLVKPNDLSRLNVAFFNINSYIALTLFAGTFLALVI